MAGHASACAGVGAAKLPSNQAATAGWNKVSGFIVDNTSGPTRRPASPLRASPIAARDWRQNTFGYRRVHAYGDWSFGVQTKPAPPPQPPLSQQASRASAPP